MNTSRDRIGQARSVSDVTNAAPLLTVAQASLTKRNIELTVDSVGKLLFLQREYLDKLLQGVILLYLNLIVIPCTKPLMETVGSIMERYHQCFKNEDPELDDKRVRKEMFVKLNAPP